MTSFDRRLRWTTLPAGTSISGASCSKRTVVPSGDRYWKRPLELGAPPPGSGHPCRALDLVHLVEGDEREDEHDRHEGGRDDRPDDLEDVVAVDLLGQLRVGRAPTEADHRDDDQPFDQDEDADRDQEDEVVEVPDRLALLGHRDRRTHRIAAGQEDRRDDQGGQRPEARTREPGHRHRIVSSRLGTGGSVLHNFERAGCSGRSRDPGTVAVVARAPAGPPAPGTGPPT